MMEENVIIHDDVEYELRYNVKRIQMIEQVTKKPMMVMIMNQHLSLTDLNACVAYGLVKKGSYSHELPKKGVEIFDKIIEEDGAYFKLSNLVSDALERDCGFFFPKG